MIIEIFPVKLGSPAELGFTVQGRTPHLDITTLFTEVTVKHRLLIVTAIFSCFGFAQSVEADITGSTITQSQSTLNTTPPVSADLDATIAGLELIDWVVFGASGTASNELAGGASDFSMLTLFNPGNEPLIGTPTNRNSWIMNFSNAANGSPASGSTFGWGPEWANPVIPDPFGMAVSVTPNIANGGRGMITIYGHRDFNFNNAVNSTTSTMTVNGGGNLGDQTWALASPDVSDHWVYTMSFDNYSGETFDFIWSDLPGSSGLQQFMDIAAIQVQGVPEPASAVLLPLLGLAMIGVRRSRKK